MNLQGLVSAALRTSWKATLHVNHVENSSKLHVSCCYPITEWRYCFAMSSIRIRGFGLCVENYLHYLSSFEGRTFGFSGLDCPGFLPRFVRFVGAEFDLFFFSVAFPVSLHTEANRKKTRIFSSNKLDQNSRTNNPTQSLMPKV